MNANTIASLLTLSLFSGWLSAQPDTNTIVPYLDSNYRYKVVGSGNLQGFEQPTYDDSDFLIGDAGFGSGNEFYGCVPNEWIKTGWPTDSDLLLRKKFFGSDRLRNVKLHLAIDNDVVVYLNGQMIGSEVHEGCATRESVVFDIPESVLRQGENLIAIRGIDRGGMSFLDLKLTGENIGEGYAIFAPRAEFTLGPRENDDSYWIRGWLKLADTSNGIDPLTEPVTIRVGSFSHTIPAGSFVQEGSAYKYVGAVGPSTLDVAFWPQAKAGAYSFKSCVKNGDLAATTVQPEVELTVGDDTGRATLDLGYGKFGTGKSGQKWVFPPAE